MTPRRPEDARTRGAVMLTRCLLLLSIPVLTACTGCIDLLCLNGFRWSARVPAEWSGEEVEAGRVRVCVNGACEERSLEPRESNRDSDGALWLDVTWDATEERASLADGDLVSITLLAADDTPIIGIAEAPVTYELAEGICDVGYCRWVAFEGSTL